MSTQRNPNPTMNEVNNCVLSMTKLCYYLDIQKCELVFEVLYEVHYGQSNSVDQHLIIAGANNTDKI